jgi:hypothetical protein
METGNFGYPQIGNRDIELQKKGILDNFNIFIPSRTEKLLNINRMCSEK